MKVIALFAVASAALPAVLAFCCGGPNCADGSGGTPCCATSSCNIFCCACGGVCRGTGKRDLLSSFATRDPGLDAFAQADQAGKGNLTMDDYLAYMSVDGKPDKWTSWFEKHDLNGDGVITENEISLQN